MEIIYKYNDDLKLKIRKLFNKNITNLYHEIIAFNTLKNNLSFIVHENSNILAFVPMSYQKVGNRNFGTFFNLSIPSPILIQNLSIKKYKKILKLIFKEIDLTCKNYNIEKLKINFCNLIKFDTNSKNFFYLLEILSDYGFKSIPFINSRINIKQDINTIYKNFSKGHKSEIKNQKKNNYIFKNSKINKINYEDFKDLSKDHSIPNEISIHLYELYLNNKLELVFTNNKDLIFCSIFSVIENTVEYFIANTNNSDNHSLIFEAIKHYKNNNEIEYLDLGITHFLENSKFNNNKKKKNICTFKKGFGGEKYILPIFEKKFIKK
jgi:hypothetical protein